ncbi:MAG: hypothetical protein BRC48_14790, partial [Cyanobacteria bacterium QS_9_48_30]
MWWCHSGRFKKVHRESRRFIPHQLRIWCGASRLKRLKETASRIDGIFVPNTTKEPIFFVEVQFQREP